jgi:L-ascorbate metabolism protein UlaG (beta-lactamase superfamily)
MMGGRISEPHSLIVPLHRCTYPFIKALCVMDLTYFGHATFQLETDTHTFLFDPFLAGNNPHTKTAPDDVDPDVVFISHPHADHFLDTEALTQQGDPLVIGTFEVITHVQEQFGHESVHPLNEGGSLDMPWGHVEAVHARHTSLFPDGSYGGVPIGFVLDFGDLTVYYTGDTAPFMEMGWIGEKYDIDVLLAPIGDVVTMGIPGAIHTATMVDADTIVPLHYDTFPFIEVDLDDFEEAADNAGFEPLVIDFDETVEL